MSAHRRLEGKLALVTGGTRGIGLAIAQALQSQGCHTMVTGRDSRRLKAAAKALGAQGRAMQCDVTSEAEIAKLFKIIHKEFAALDVLVNNAGIAHPLAPVQKLSPQVWRQVIETNLTGMFLVTHAALPLMRADGTIVNNLSIAAKQSFDGMSAYNASKAGALGFTNVLRQELRSRGIRVIALLPGATRTEIWEQFWPDAPKERMVDPELVAQAVLQAVTLPANTTVEEIQIGPTAGAL